MTADNSKRPLSVKLDSIERAIERRTAAKVVQLPLWADTKRGTPNSFLRSALFSAIESKDRTQLKRVEVFSQEKIKIEYTGEQLNQEDLTLWETLVHFAKNQPLGNIVDLTGYAILKEMGLSTGGKEHERIQSGIDRLVACAVSIRVENNTYTGNLVQKYFKDETTRRYRIELNKDLISLFGESQWTAIDWEQRRQLLRKPLALGLHAYYSSHRYPYPVSLEFLRKMTGSRNKQLADFKRKVRAALTELKDIGFLQDFSIDGETVKVSRVPVLTRE